jgi:hypothetical protein
VCSSNDDLDKFTYFIKFFYAFFFLIYKFSSSNFTLFVTIFMKFVKMGMRSLSQIEIWTVVFFS